ncbi:MAG: phosphatase [Gallicola sp.]|nr:phosphatase [Gallicola sp.]
MKQIMDLHTHTSFCNHAYSSLKENMDYSHEIGLKVLGWSEHGYGMPGTTVRPMFFNFRVIQDYYKDVRILKGMEANIFNYQGDIFEEEVLGKMDYVIASLHKNTIKPGTIEENTNAVMKAMDNPRVNILGHIHDGTFPLDYKTIVQKAADKNIAIEVNNSSFIEKTFRKDSKKNIQEILNWAKTYKTKIIMNSDAHIHYEIGNVDLSIEQAAKNDFPEELIINNSIGKLEKLLEMKVL